jgi:hypothetical protein
MKCAWWNRWWHRRLRKIDRKIMIPMLIANSRLLQPDDPSLPLRAFLSFAGQRGQGHWHCACSEQDWREVFEMIEAL